MKKVLFASTALVLSAGVAAADVTLSGDGRMGITYISDRPEVLGQGGNYQFTSRIRITFTASGQTDGGLGFGGSIRADNAGGGAAGTAGSVFISGDFGTLSMGDVDGGFKKETSNLPGVGLTGLSDFSDTIFLVGGQDPTALYNYAGDGFSVSVALSDDGDYSLGASYSSDSFTIGAGYEFVNEGTPIAISIEDNDIIVGTIGTDLAHYGASIDFTFGDSLISANYNETESVADAGGEKFVQYGFGYSGTFDMTTVNAFWRTRDFGVNGKSDFYGIGASYDLGGGAALKGGVAQTNPSGAAGSDERTFADFGISFSF